MDRGSDSPAIMELNENLDRCEVASLDLTDSSDLLDGIVASPRDKGAAMNELNDFEKLYETFSEAHMRVRRLCKQLRPEEMTPLEERRKRFLILYKNIRNRVINFLSEFSQTTAECTTTFSTRFKLPKVEIPEFVGKLEEWGVI
ncbi:hypothetical protein PGB90_010130 [Kerria lacca]